MKWRPYGMLGLIRRAFAAHELCARPNESHPVRRSGAGGELVMGWFGRLLSKLTGASVNISVNSGRGPLSDRSQSRHYTRTETFKEPVIRKEVTYGSLDEVPPELRDQFASLMEDARNDPSGVHVYETTAQRVTVKDADGTTRTYDSIEDMPPEIRDKFASLLAQAQSDPSNVKVYETKSEHVTVTGPDGLTHSYDTLDDLAPELRAEIERQLRHKRT